MSSLPATYKQAVFKQHGAKLTLEEVTLTPPSRGEILVKVEACGVCHSDHFAQTNLMGGGFPLVPGHEIIGRVAAVGEGETAWKVGDRIGGAWHGGHDGTCRACKKGYFQMCDNEQVNGISKNGGYAEYCLINQEAAIHIPEHVDAAEYAPMLCAGVTVFNSIRQMNIPSGEVVAIQGLGGLGHLALQYANKFGYKVVALSRGSEKEEFARKLGAHEYIDTSRDDAVAKLQEMGGASLIVSTAPVPEIINPLIQGLGVLGKLLILSIVGGIEIHTGLLVGKGKSIWSWPSGHATDSEDAIAFADLHGIDCMVQEFPLEKCNEAFDAMMEGSVRFRAVITMQ
ncbi:Polyketide synthase enoylreductase [Penicillium nucicola]|uniref:Polyketide synthase enoylreductase n=1 Tax=Penicillium nucicola TaxID=1850975 RepID=UPI002545752B|nr:Polyketide synthase enoylreductase [Penicillium nucicola]KAJ5753793.1 Polyketide synthase enoylreductase [Penicillium nucicola]